ncbi:16S rRNA (guanine(527)-N(7))-methyltransferase RsmG [Clostridium cylindrosporum]|uniref:Ribosomal RNA small subunit methyltransferase G n=1 Tax=Clostridium cylindrosporum DSM 605 TaxID=1121307 RepID=A0A0J8G1X1_CLOCY|nr:16S rRNA (guanine(527)-N(7))-methyltransferase RsmG [Clostridium cylindrosporum]KMT21751.1 ribosomal RNA small subunit methyltransferase G [Clostridium cylindrosporum DSM 605]
MIENMLKEGAAIYGVDLTDEQVKQFMTYKNLLQEWNEKINLTAITDDEGVIKKHFIDSIAILKSNVIEEGATVIDVGTGAGFPGIPLKIIRPDIKLTLLDSLNKRIKFLETVCNEAGLEGVKCVHMRAEDGGRDKTLREKYDIATARAVANMRVLSEYCMPFVKVGGHFVALKGPSGYDELNDARNAVGTLGGKCREIIETTIPGEDIKHNLIVVEKHKSTEARFPRVPKQIDKKPL